MPSSCRRHARQKARPAAAASSRTRIANAVLRGDQPRSLRSDAGAGLNGIVLVAGPSWGEAIAEAAGTGLAPVCAVGLGVGESAGEGVGEGVGDAVVADEAVATAEGKGAGGAFTSDRGEDAGAGFVSDAGGALIPGPGPGAGVETGAGVALAVGAGLAAGGVARGEGAPSSAGPWTVGVGVSPGWSWKSSIEGGAAAPGRGMAPAVRASRLAMRNPGLEAFFMVPVAMPELVAGL